MNVFRIAIGGLLLIACGGASAQSVDRGQYNATPPTLSDGALGNLQLDPNGNLKTVASGTPSGTQDVNLAKVNGVTTQTGAGAVGTGSARVAVGQDTTTIAGSAPGAAGTASANVVSVQGIASMTPVQTVSTGPYPNGAVPETISATGTTGATTATLAATSNKTTYICGFSIRANATAAATGNATVTGTVTGTMNFTQWTAPNTSGLGVTEMVFMPCVPASAVNTTISVVSAAPGTGGVVSVSAWGYEL